MELNDLIGYIKELDLKAVDIICKKNHDYAAPESDKDNPLKLFKNLMACEFMGITKTEQGMLIRLTDKFSRLCNLLKEGHKIAVKDESLEDTVIDIQNYLKLLLAYRKVKKSYENPPQGQKPD
uniref:Nucleotide modification associated domain-containing protein n=1 Tax=viral metagenome TaxID=1070528 RepID=A0A6H1ZEN3_9ZZZZ